MWRADSLEKTLMLGKIDGRRRRDERLRWLDGITDLIDMSLSKLREIVKDREAWHAAIHGFAKSQTQLSDWTRTKLWAPEFCYTFHKAAAAAKSLQSCPTLGDPIDGSPPGSPVPGILQARILEWVVFPSPMHEREKWKWGRSVLSNSERPHGLQPTRLLRPWDFPDKSTGVGSHCLLWHFTIHPHKNAWKTMIGSKTILIFVPLMITYIIYFKIANTLVTNNREREERDKLWIQD